MNTLINVNVQGEIRFPDLALLARAIAGKASSAPAPTAPPETPVAPAPVTPPQAPAVPPAPVADIPTAPPPAIPTSAPTYSIDDIARAGALLAQQGPEKLSALNALLQQFGLQSLTELRSEQTPAFVQAMRGLGAQI